MVYTHVFPSMASLTPDEQADFFCNSEAPRLMQQGFSSRF
jgi:hypothetical protein